MLKILLVEDSLILRDRLRAIISGIPNALLVAEADNEDDARTHLEAYCPNVAIVDLRLRSGSGLAVISHITALYSSTTLIVLTNLVQPEYRTKCMALGAHYFFDKSKGTGAFTKLLIELSMNSVEQGGNIAALGGGA